MNENYRPNNLKALVSFVTLIGMTGTSAILSTQDDWALFALGELLMTALMWSWFSILHSTGHFTYFQNRKANLLSGHISSLFVFVPFHSWQEAHSLHHKWTGYRDLDPSANEIPSTPPSEGRLKIIEFFWKLGFPVVSLWHAYNSLLQSPNSAIRTKVRISQVFLYVPHLAFLLWAPLTWARIFILPYLAFLTISDAVLLSQHALFPLEQSSRNGGSPSIRPKSVALQEKLSRTFRVHPWIDRWVFLNFNLHNAHHRYPQIPHYFLHKIDHEPSHQVGLFKWWLFLRRTSLTTLFWSQRHE